MTERLVVVGAGGHGREALAVARAVDRAHNRWSTIGLADDDQPGTDLDGDRLDRISADLLGPIEIVIENADQHVIAIGDPAVRRRLAARIGSAAPAISLVDPSAWIGDDVEYHDGVLIFPGVVSTTNIRIGRHSHLNCGVVVSHDCRIGAFVSLSPGVLLNGAVTIEDGAFLGSGAIVLPGRRVGQDAVIGAGAVVTTDVAAGTTVVGVPAR